MKIFLSHNSKDKPLAESLATSLRQEGHIVFFDKTDLPPGESYNDQIREAILKCDLFLFLVSPDSISTGGYAKTEIKFAQQKWPSPSGHVLSVMARPIADADLPPYLQSVTYLRPEGNLIAETIQAVSTLSSKASRKQRLKVLSILGIFGLAAISVFLAIKFFPVPERLPPADIVVTRFDGEDSTFKVSRQIETAIQKELVENGLESVSIKFVDQAITQNVDAQEIVESASAKAVIWGWRDATNINIRIAVSPVTGKSSFSDRGVGMVDVSPINQDLSIVATNLQNAVKTTALYVVAQLFYRKDEYGEGHKAMDAAMKSLPNDDSVIIENVALVEFLKGRKSFADGDFVGAASHYVNAINSDPNMAAAYNNLAITYAKLRKTKDEFLSQENFESEPATAADGKDNTAAFEQLDSQIRKGSLFGLIDDWDSWPDYRLDPSELFGEAMKLEPKNTAIRYNEVAYSWELVHYPEEKTEEQNNVDNYLTKDIDTGPWKQKLEGIVQDDSSIAGAFAMLGAINFDDEKCSEAVKNYQKAVELSPKRAELHNDLGLSYFCEKDYKSARSELELTANYSQKEWQLPKLNLANVMIKAGDPIKAEKIISGLIEKEYEEGLGPDYELLSAAAHFAQNDIEGFKRALNQVEERFAKQGLPPEPLTYGPHGEFMPDLDQLLKAWVLEMEGKQAAANKILEQISPGTNHPPTSPTKFMLRYLGAAVPLTWFDLEYKCANNRPISEWGGGCLPDSPRERIQHVLDMYQDRLALSIFYRANIYYADRACPYIYSHDTETGTWKFETAILVNFGSKQFEGEQTHPLSHFGGKLLISEKERETSYIDQIYVTAKQADGTEIRLVAADEKLKNKDGHYLVLQPGQSRAVLFDAPSEGMKSVDHKRYRVTAHGYYVPLK